MSEFSQIFIDHRILQALYAIRRDDEQIQSLISRYLEDRLKTDYPGIFDVIQECVDNSHQAREANKARVNAWKKTLAQLNQ